MDVGFEGGIGDGTRDREGSPIQQWTLKASPRKGEAKGLFDAEPSFSFGSQSDVEVLKDDGQASADSSGDGGGGGFLFQRSENSIIEALTPKRRINGGILRAPDTPGTGQSVRFGKRLYDDGDESRVSDSLSNNEDLRSPSKAPPTLSSQFPYPLSPGPLGGMEGDDSADVVEMSTASVRRERQQQQQPGDDSSGSLANLPTMEGYSNLMDEEVSMDESVLRSSIERETCQHLRSVESSSEVASSPAPTGEEGSPASTRSSHYRTAVSPSVVSTPFSEAADQDWETPKSSLAEGRGQQQADSKETIVASALEEEGFTSDLSIPWSVIQTTQSPSAARAERMEASMASLSAIMVPGGLSRKLFDPHSPSPLRQVMQAAPSSSSSKTQLTSDSGQHESCIDEAFSQTALSTVSSVLRTSSGEKEATIDDILRATHELDAAHLERTEVLLRRMQQAENEAKSAVAQAEKEQAATLEAKEEAQRLRATLAEVQAAAEDDRKRSDEKLNAVDLLVKRLQEQLERRSVRHTSNHSASLDVPKTTDAVLEGSIVEQLRRDVRSELEQDFELERYTLRRQYDDEVDQLKEKLLQAELEMAQVQDKNLNNITGSLDAGETSFRADPERTQLHRDIDELRARLSQTEDAQRLLDEKVVAYDELSKQRDELRAELQSQWNRSDEAHERQVALDEHIQQLEQQLESAKQTADTEQKQAAISLEAERQTTSALNGQLRQLQSSLQEREDRLKEVEERLPQLESQVLIANERTSKAESLLGTITREAKEKTASSDVEKSSLIEQVNKMRERIAQLEESVSAKDRENATMREELSVERERFITLHNTVSGWESQCASMEKELVQAQSRITDLQLEGSTAHRGIEAIRRELGHSQNELIQARKSVALAEGQLKLLQQERGEMLTKMTESEQKARLDQSEVEMAREKVTVSEQEKEVLLNAISEAEEHHASVVQSLQMQLNDQDSRRQPSNAQSEEQQKIVDLLDLAEQMQRRIDELETSQTGMRKRVVELEQEVSDRGLTMVKMQKAKDRLEADNASFSIALASKQQELSFLKRRTSTRRASQASEATPDVMEQTAKQRMPLQQMQAKADIENGSQGGEDETLPALQKGPAHLKATRRKTIDGRIANDGMPGGRQNRTVSGRLNDVQTSPASKAMPPPASRAAATAAAKRSTGAQRASMSAPRKTSDSSSASSNSLTARKVAESPPRLSSSMARTSRASMMSSASSSVSALHGPMDVSELIPTSSLSLAPSALRSSTKHPSSDVGPSASTHGTVGHQSDRIVQLAGIRAPTHSLSTTNTARPQVEGRRVREAQLA